MTYHNLPRGLKRLWRAPRCKSSRREMHGRAERCPARLHQVQVSAIAGNPTGEHAVDFTTLSECSDAAAAGAAATFAPLLQRTWRRVEASAATPRQPATSRACLQRQMHKAFRASSHHSGRGGARRPAGSCQRVVRLAAAVVPSELGNVRVCTACDNMNMPWKTRCALQPSASCSI